MSDNTDFKVRKTPLDKLPLDKKGYFHLFKDYLEFELKWNYDFEKENEVLAISEHKKGAIHQRAFIMKVHIEAIFMEFDSEDEGFRLIIERTSGRAYSLNYGSPETMEESYNKLMNWRIKK